MFANQYIEKHNIKNRLSSPATEELSFVVVIPCYNEPDIKHTLNCLFNCMQPTTQWDIIVVINHEERAEKNVILENQKTWDFLINNKQKYASEKIQLHTIWIKDIPKKDAGVGFARKIGMDQAIFRFNMINKADGIIVSLDADTTVSKNYFRAIESCFSNNPGLDGANIHFEHQLTENNQQINQAIILYELHLRYLVESLKTIPHPCAVHTLGSAFCVRASTYAKQGGMNRKKGGEDFYFIQKINALGNYGFINNASVYPSPRLSARVPFGTGPAIQKIIKDEFRKNSYSPDAFSSLRIFFLLIIQKKEVPPDEIYETFPDEIKTFLPFEKFNRELLEIRQHTKHHKNFIQRMYNRYNGLFVVKYLNHYHKLYNKGKDIRHLACGLIKESHPEIKVNSDARELLNKFQKIQGNQA